MPGGVGVGMSEHPVGTSSVGAHGINGSSSPSKAYKAGRVCRHPECDTVLSIYNSGTFCYQHEPMSIPRMRGRKIA